MSFKIVSPIGSHISISKSKKLNVLTLKKKGFIYRDEKGIYVSGKVNTYLKEWYINHDKK